MQDSDGRTAASLQGCGFVVPVVEKVVVSKVPLLSPSLIALETGILKFPLLLLPQKAEMKDQRLMLLE